MPSLYEAVAYQAIGAISKVTPLSDPTRKLLEPVTGQNYFQKDYLAKTADRHVDLFRPGNLLQADKEKRENGYKTKDAKNINQILYQAALNPCYN